MPLSSQDRWILRVLWPLLIINGLAVVVSSYPQVDATLIGEVFAYVGLWGLVQVWAGVLIAVTLHYLKS